MESLPKIMTEAGAGIQAAAQGTSALAKTAAQVNQAAQQVPLGAAASLTQPIQVAITELGSAERKFHQMFQLPLNPSVQQIDTAVEKMVNNYFIANGANIKQRYFENGAVILACKYPGGRTVSDLIEAIVDGSLGLAEEFSETLRPLFWDSLKRHVVAHIVELTTPGICDRSSLKAQLGILFDAIYRTKVLGFFVG
jgi:hypothetical protein